MHMYEHFAATLLLQALLSVKGLNRPTAQLTMDGSYVVPVSMKHKGLHLAWEVLPPAWCTRNPPYAATAAAVARMKGLKYRGYTVVQVRRRQGFEVYGGVYGAGNAVSLHCFHV